jgi:predicted nucleic acid-binding protein
MIVDTSALLAFFDSAEPRHRDVARAIEAAGELMVVSPYVIAELDYLVATRHGVRAELAVLDELGGGAWELACLDVAELRTARTIVDRYADQRIGLADASNVVLAQRFGQTSIATLDRRHFSVLRALDGSTLTLVP